ncbi:hypothetical protein [uncultured Microbulbifer sp.]|uniref:hypothetical protein n=1 Tax=uncultured Microbulbifer sp. TaxID=348147 RepID=UPI002606B0D3|nr:hypothetical protein [uncultured Microbulbifer sp.]
MNEHNNQRQSDSQRYAFCVTRWRSNINTKCAPRRLRLRWALCVIEFMSIEIDKIRKLEHRKQLLLLPVAIVFTCVWVALYVFHVRTDIHVSGNHLWGISKYIWLNTAIVFCGLAICSIFSLFSRLLLWSRLKGIPNFRVKKGVAVAQLAKCMLVAVVSSVTFMILQQLIFDNVQWINRQLLVDSGAVELVSFYMWLMGTFLILGAYGGYLVLSIKAPFQFVKNNEIHIDFSANDGGTT